MDHNKHPIKTYACNRADTQLKPPSLSEKMAKIGQEIREQDRDSLTVSSSGLE